MPALGLPLPVTFGAFAVLAVLVWYAGSRLSEYAAQVAQRSRLGQAYVGFLLLGIATSLPEIATTVTAGVLRESALALNNLLGGVAVQMVVIAVADAASGGTALSAFVRRRPVLIQAGLLGTFLVAAMAGVLWPAPRVGPVDLWSIVLGLGYLGTVVVLRRAMREVEGPGPQKEGLSKVALVLRIAAASATILAAGVLLVFVAQDLAQQTGMGANVAGAVFLALSTSLPEISTAVPAAQRGHATLAFSNILGTNILEVALILVADAANGATSLFDQAGTFALAIAALALLLTGIYAVGVALGVKRTFARMGWDSWLVLVAYAAGLFAASTLLS